MEQSVHWGAAVTPPNSVSSSLKNASRRVPGVEANAHALGIVNQHQTSSTSALPHHRQRQM
jgi:hypothetical protein